MTERFEIVLPCVAVEDITDSSDIYYRLMDSIQDRIRLGQLRELVILQIALDSGAAIICQTDSAKMADSQE